ncbi:MAG TPA: metallophosphoesterase, partial [Candidatus Polarisedimenticolaceae bacterium]|nr:metallophosphoesterase [Candidatus Polarisedimenticolaceae bacterium]
MAKKKQIKKRPAGGRKTLTRKHHISIFAVLVIILVAVAAILQMVDQGRASGDPVIVAVGDIACDPTDASYNGGNGTATNCRMKATSDLALSINPTNVVILGDNQYENGTLSAFQASYDPTWGRLKAITKPAVGNHEYQTPGATGYYDYFGAAAGDRSKGYYSYNLGAWHMIVLNSNCTYVACGVGSAQEAWLRADLASHTQTCTLAYWHHPRFSSGAEHGNNTLVQPLWQALHEARADVILTGHDHTYERFAAQRADGVADGSAPTEFVIGTGGKNHYAFGAIKVNSLAHNNTNYGVLKMTLHSASYDWQFIAEGGGIADSGTAACVVPSPVSPSAPAPAAAPASPVAKSSAAKTTTSAAPGALSSAAEAVQPGESSDVSPAAQAKKDKAAKTRAQSAEPKRNFFEQ